MVAVGGGVGVGVDMSAGVGVGGCVGIRPWVGVAGGAGVAKSEGLLASVAERSGCAPLAMGTELVALGPVEVVAYCTVADTPPQVSKFAPQSAATLSILALPFAGGVGSETRTVSGPSVGIGTVEPVSGERMANAPSGTGTVTVVDAPCSSA
jgi:hypothetical protein